MSSICDICDTEISHSQNILKHKKTEKCQKIKILLDKRDNINNEKINLLLNENKELKNEIVQLKYNITEKDIKIKLIEEEYWKKQKILKNKEDKKENINNDTAFHIDINLNNKQLNKTKYKDIPEDIIKKEIQSLKLKDNYQLEYREEDGFINITNLCKAGGKQFKHWNSIDKTKKFLDVLSREVGIPTSELIKRGTGSKYENDIKNLTWAHPQVSINIAQWISPEFDVLVSKWVYEIMLTGKVDIRDNKITQELDIMNKENKLLKNRIKLLESKVLQKQPRETFDNSKNVIYIVTTEYKEAQGHYKIGKTQDLQKRLSTYNTTDKHEVIYYTSCGDKETMDILEKLIHKKLNSKRIEPNKEWFVSEEDGEDFIKVIEECKKIVCE
uniref:KilA-N domain-containing protein n=1 Tax=viral metagenome TaxID=1070528 RepID=A0A6C0I6Q1_9ZZZZ